MLRPKISIFPLQKSNIDCRFSHKPVADKITTIAAKPLRDDNKVFDKKKQRKSRSWKDLTVYLSIEMILFRFKG